MSGFLLLRPYLFLVRMRLVGGIPIHTTFELSKTTYGYRAIIHSSWLNFQKTAKILSLEALVL